MNTFHVKTKSGHPIQIGNFEISEIVATPLFFKTKPEEATLGGHLVQTIEHWKLFFFLEHEWQMGFLEVDNAENRVWEVHAENELVGILRQHRKKGNFLFWKFDLPVLLPVSSHFENTDCRKVAYATYNMAQKTLKDMPNRTERLKQPIRAYRCHKCGLYHLTSTELLF